MCKFTHMQLLSQYAPLNNDRKCGWPCRIADASRFGAIWFCSDHENMGTRHLFAAGLPAQMLWREVVTHAVA